MWSRNTLELPYSTHARIPFPRLGRQKAHAAPVGVRGTQHAVRLADAGPDPAPPSSQLWRRVPFFHPRRERRDNLLNEPDIAVCPANTESTECFALRDFPDGFGSLRAFRVLPPLGCQSWTIL